MQSNILLIPWTPTLNRRKCASYSAYNQFAEEGASPNPIDNTYWALENLGRQLEERPDGKDALWEGILALWQLKLFEVQGAIEKMWQGLVSAWLVCNCQSMCCDWG